jgi:monoamine oxidase
LSDIHHKLDLNLRNTEYQTMTNTNKPKPAASQGEVGEQQEPQAQNQGAAAPGEAHSDKESQNARLAEWEAKLGKERVSQLQRLADAISFGGYSGSDINSSRATENDDGLQIVSVKVPSKSSGEERDDESERSK